MKKAFGQTVRDLKRGVNKKVLKVPGIEQKVLDATNNESWGPHGSLLAEIAHASRNYHEYQLTMGVLWKRLSDTGKNWRHVYKALTVLEYMVGHGSERVIEEIKERAYQISTLSGFQYVDSSGKDQGSNVRKKAQSLVALINDSERIAEVREKAATNRDKYYNPTVGGMHRPSEGYGDKYDYECRYGDKDEWRCSYGREREYGNRDDDRNSRDGDCYSRDSEDRYGRDGNRDDEYRGRSRSVDNFQHGSRGRSSDRERPIEDDGRSSSRDSGAQADDHSQDGRVGLEKKFSEQNIGAAPPSYEEAVSESRSPVYIERDGGETPQVVLPGAAVSPPVEHSSVDNKAVGFVNKSPPQHVDPFDEFDPRGSVSACAPTTGASAPAPSPPTVVSTSTPPSSNIAEMDLLGSLSDVFSSNSLAIVTSDSTSVETNGQANTGPTPSFSTSHSSTQPFDDPFGDTPFKAITSANTDPSQHQSFGAAFQLTPNSDIEHNFGFGEAFPVAPSHESGVQNMQAPLNSSFLSQEQFDTLHSEIDILAGILPPSGPPVSFCTQANTTMPTSQFPANGNSYESYHHRHHAAPTDLNMPEQTPFSPTLEKENIVSHSQNHVESMQFNNGGFTQQPGYAGSAYTQPSQYTPDLSSHPTSESFPHQPVSDISPSAQTPYATTPSTPGQIDGGNFMTQQPYGVTQQVQGLPSHIPHGTQSQPAAAHGNNNNVVGSMHQPGFVTSSSSQTSYPTTLNAPVDQFDGENFMTQQAHGVTQQVHGVPSHIPQQTQSGYVAAYGNNNNNVVGDMHQPGSATSSSSQTSYPTTPNAPAGQFDGVDFMTQQAHGETHQVHGVPSHILQRAQSGPVEAYGNNNNIVGDMFAPAKTSSLETSASQPSLTPLTGAIEVVPQSQKKFEPKSTIWADTLSRGLVNFNISGPKTNPLADIGVDFEAINRKEKRLEKPTTAQQQVTSTINMGKAMGSGNGLGRAGAGAMRPPTNSMVGSSMNVGGYGGMNQNHTMGIHQNHPMGMNQHHPMGMNQHHPMGMNQNHPMGMNQNHPMGMGMNMNIGGCGQSYPMQLQQGMAMVPPSPPPGMTGAYNPMMGQDGYNPQQQQPNYGGGPGGYR